MQTRNIFAALMLGFGILGFGIGLLVTDAFLNSGPPPIEQQLTMNEKPNCAIDTTSAGLGQLHDMHNANANFLESINFEHAAPPTSKDIIRSEKIAFHRHHARFMFTG